MQSLYRTFTFDKIHSVNNDIANAKWEWYYKINKCIYACIKEMSAKDYLIECAAIRGIGDYKTEYNATNAGSIRNIAECIKAGRQFYAPVLDYVNHTQDGRHRCLACDLLGFKKIPVVCICSWTETMQAKELDLPANYYISNGFLYNKTDSCFARGPILYMNKQEAVEYISTQLQ